MPPERVAIRDEGQCVTVGLGQWSHSPHSRVSSCFGLSCSQKLHYSVFGKTDGIKELRLKGGGIWKTSYFSFTLEINGFRVD